MAANMITFVMMAFLSFGLFTETSAARGSKTLDDVFNEIISMKGQLESLDNKVTRLIAPHCAAAKSLDEAWRHIDYSNSFVGKSDWCDKTGNPHQGRTYHTQLTPGWYRFTGAAGAKLPTTPSGYNSKICGTEGPAYITHGGHPTVSEGVVTREICFEGYDNKCQETSSSNNPNENKMMIKVAACEDPSGVFYVYQLQPVSYCSWAYCAVDN